MPVLCRRVLVVLWMSLFISDMAGAIEVVVGAAGDLSFSDNHIATNYIHPDVSPNGVWDHATGWGKVSNLTAEIQPLFWESDLNFLNLETVLSPSKSGFQSNKTHGFAFLSHPQGVKDVIEGLNVNLFSLANNHAFDFSYKGLFSTRENMAAVERQYPFVHSSGIFKRGENIAPVEFMVAGKKVAFAAMNGAGGYGGGDIAVANFFKDSDYQEMIKAFRRSDADLKILSIHYGTEGQVTLNKGQRDRFRYAVDYGGVNLILGHHPHVVRPVEIYKGAVIFYSFGNFLATGTAAVDGRRTSNGTPDYETNYGLFGRTYFNLENGSAQVTAVEAVPLVGTNWQVHLASRAQSAHNIAALNRLNRSELGENGVNFQLGSSGWGVLCTGLRGGVRSQKLCH
jgi:poly-gamma-glutamate synthesis protein (capsule biosynthesis protein)